MTILSTIDVTGPSPYTVTVGRGLHHDVAAAAAALPGATRAAIVYQQPLGEYVSPLQEALADAGLSVVTIPVPDAEDGKTITTCEMAWARLGDNLFSRRDVIISFGGGAACDLAGFIAAAWMRGIPVIHVPTTLLAMVDASVGGKTGVNTAAGKNLVGAFHEPAGVFIDLDRLDTLPAGEIVAGSAEIIKTGFIQDPKIIDLYDTDPEACTQPQGHLPELITRSVAVKAAVVAADLKESNLREILNYGHTFGHAVELNEHFQWRHGRAVAVGMMFAAELGHLAGITPRDLVDRHSSVLSSIGLDTTYTPGCFDQLLAGMRRDKKNRAGTIRFVVLGGLAEPTRFEGPTDEQLQAAYRRISAR